MDNLKFHLGRRAQVEFENTEIRKKHIPGRGRHPSRNSVFLEPKMKTYQPQKYRNNEIWTKIARGVDCQC